MNYKAQARWEQKRKPKKQQQGEEDNQGITGRVSQGFQQVKAWATEMAKTVWASLIDEEGEA